ncbi:hypothetical protein B9G55_11660 [Saccharibacillus sp. O16]|nr:hypothetical protein B9G55_11660 [Saccharibacillus sp. O16]
MNLSYNDIYGLADHYNIPLAVTIELNTTCNLRCKHCYIPEHNNVGLSFDEISSMLHQLRALGTFELVFTGGEIFARRDIMDIIRMAREMHFEVILFTNVTLLNPKMINELKELYVTMVSTTIFSLDPEIHDGITKVKNSLHTALKNLQLLKEAGVPVEVKTILLSDNYNSFLELETYCKNEGFRYIATPYVFAKSDQSAEPTKLRMTSEQMEEVMEDVDRISGFEVREKCSEDYVCPSIKHSLGINAEGMVSPCNAMFMDVGNIRQNSIESIWNSDKLNAIKNIMFKDLNRCTTCEVSKYCVRCAGTALLEDGGLLNPSTLACQVARARAVHH